MMILMITCLITLDATVAAKSVHDAAAASQPIGAGMTPIIPGGTDRLPAYQLFVETDLPILSLGLVMALSRLVRTQPANCRPLCPRSELNPLDRLTAGYYDPGWSVVSDVAVLSLLGGAFIALWADEGVIAALNDLLVIFESALSGAAFASFATLTLQRPRPFMYSTAAPAEKRNGNDAAMSFVSGHSAVAFGLAVSTFITFARIHPGKTWPWVVLAATLSAAGVVALGRVLGGNHFISDVVTGGIVGASFGVLVPAVHQSPITVVPTVSSQSVSLTLMGTF